jgi:hypothetical protein
MRSDDYSEYFLIILNQCRFGRWRGWIEKRYGHENKSGGVISNLTIRAAERYADVSPEERSRRRQRGWGNEVTVSAAAPQKDPSSCNRSPKETRDVGQSVTLPNPHGLPTSHEALAPLTKLHIQTTDLSSSSSQPFISPTSSRIPSPPLPPLPFVSQRLSPTHLKISHFGSRFLPHTTSPIRCLLPLESDRLLLIGHDEGLSVLTMFPQEWTETGVLSTKGPDEAQARLIWRGERYVRRSLLT